MMVLSKAVALNPSYAIKVDVRVQRHIDEDKDLAVNARQDVRVIVTMPSRWKVVILVTG